jgi:hypothetical protein
MKRRRKREKKGKKAVSRLMDWRQHNVLGNGKV